MSRAARLAELKALRAAGKTRLASYQVQEEEKVYEEVDEEGYKKVVRSRLDRDDFVVDDNGAGYADDGREEWMAERNYDSSSGSELDVPVKGKAAKRKREEDQERAEKTNNSINKYFASGATMNVPKPKPKPVASAADHAFMADLLGEVDNNIGSRRATNVSASTKALKSENRRKVRVLEPAVDPLKLKKKKAAPAPVAQVSTPPSDSENTPIIEDDCLPRLNDDDDDDILMSDPVPSSPIEKAKERKAQVIIKAEPEDEYDQDREADDDLMEVSRATAGRDLKAASVNISGSRPVPAPKVVKKESSYPTPENSSPTRPPADAIDASAWTNVTSKLNVLGTSSQNTAFGKVNPQNAAEADGSLRFFWTDYTDVNGSLCLFGKVKDKSTGSFASAFVKIDNILRKVYFLPRVNKQKNGRDTSEEVEMVHVFEEVDDLMSKLRSSKNASRAREFKIKECSRKYAFELPDIPKEADYLKLMYPYDEPALPMDLSGDSFSHAFGTNTALFEQFVLWKNIMGPCWLTIDSGEYTTLNNASWCKLEVQIESPKAIALLPQTENLDAPPFNIMSLSFRTTLNVKENKQEILIASARVYENVSLTDTTPPEKMPCRTFTIMRPMGNSYPVGFDALCKKQRGAIMLEKSEQMLLSKFMAMLERADPDILLGHQLQDVDYPILLSRLRERKTPSWHRIGRLRRTDWPKNFGKGAASFFAERQLVAGRLLCDIANDMGRSLMMKCQSWSLTEMCSLYLPGGAQRQEIDYEAALKTWASGRDGLLNYLNHCEADTYFTAAVAFRIQIVPLSKVLTNLAGNSWARTLTGTRAERNEYILLHEFHKNKYICPDKIYGRNKAKVEADVDGEEGTEGKKKDKYKGGLVFEPEKGLYDKFILVMDFNSLYPSIIQEYNICFTTVDRSSSGQDEDKVPEVPTESQQGILPRLISTLVKRRREVKKLMKDKRATPEELATWDIKQFALKLTANSMYGCLGFTQSRFYARPLAMLTTFKGREILMSTKELAESTQLRVVYGDTDSVMINTNADTIEAALKVGHEFKKNVNDRYKLLEIDIDNVFRRLLLHAKKKYAAINLVEVDGKYVEKLEVKGLDMKRREYCSLSKDASSHLLNDILSGDDPEVVVSKICDYLRELSKQMREEKIPNQKYIIYTKLGKDPKSYPNAESMPQVQVALRAINAGKSVRVNDVISYITAAVSEQAPSDSAAKRAFSPMDVAKLALKPDIDWYLAKQIFPPIERLCAPIDGTQPEMLAECLGLDPKKYAAATGGTAGGGRSGAEWEITPLESQLPDATRYKDCPRLRLVCPACRHDFQFDGLVGSFLPSLSSSPSESDPDRASSSTGSPEPESKRCITSKGLVCPSPACGRPLRTLTLVAQVERAVRLLASSYYDGWLACDDASCGVARTRGMSVYGHRCLGPRGLASGCLGKMRFETPGKLVGATLGYWRGLWDVDKKLPPGVEDAVARAAARARARAGVKVENREAKDADDVAGVGEGGNGTAGNDSKKHAKDASSAAADDGGPAAQLERLDALREWNRVAFTTVREVLEQYERRCGWVWVQMDGLFSFAVK